MLLRCRSFETVINLQIVHESHDKHGAKTRFGEQDCAKPKDLKALRLNSTVPTMQLLGHYLFPPNQVRFFEAPHNGVRLENLLFHIQV